MGSLAADPLYSLVDTAFVGNLGTPQLGAVAVGTAAFNASFWLFSFLAYGVTPKVAGAVGANDARTASQVGVQALLLATLIGFTVSLIGLVFAGPIVGLLGANGRVAAFAEPYLRIRVLSSIPLLIATVGHGWLRGDQDTRTPMYIAGAGAAANVVLDYVLIYPLGWGIEGAAWATVIGQGGAAIAFLVVLARRMHQVVWRLDLPMMRSLLTIGGDLIVRAGALVAALTISTAVAARMGLVELGSWQIAMQVFSFLALTLDSIAIAGQALVGRYLGAGRRDEAAEMARRLMTWGLGLGVVLFAALFVLRRSVASLFSDDPAVIAASAGLLGWLAVVQPLSAAAFTLDGILIGASDTRFLAAAMVVASALFIGGALLSLGLGWGTVGLAAAATLWLAARTAALGKRLQGGRWAY